MQPKFTTTHKRLASGQKKVYYYYRGICFFHSFGEQIVPPYPPEFVKAFKEAVDEKQHRRFVGDCDRFINEYTRSTKFTERSEATRKGYHKALDKAREKFGTASIKVMEDRRFRGAVIAWQHECAQTSPRQADLNIQALSLALGHAHKTGQLLHNPAADIDPLYKRPDNKQPWMFHEVEAFLDGARPAEREAFLLARYTGLRRTDLARITWAAFKGDHIEWLTSKGRGKRLVIVPLTGEAIAFLKALRSAHTSAVTMLVGDRGKPVQPRRVGDLVNDRANKLGIAAGLHQLRNTYIVDLIRANFSDEEIAETVGWSLADVRYMKRVYASRDEINQAKIKKLRTERNRG